MQQATKWLLYAQLTLTVAALVLAALSLTPSRTTTTSGMTVVSGAMVSTPVIGSAVILIAAAVLALVALRKRKQNLYTWAAIALLAPLLSAIATSVTSPAEDVADLQYLENYGIGQQIRETTRWLEWSSWLTLGAMLLAATAAVLLLQLRRKQVTS